MRAAITTLGTGFLRHPANTSLRGENGPGPDVPAFSTALLRLTHRILALGLIEQRGLLHPVEASPAARRRYAALRAHWHDPVADAADPYPDGPPDEGERYLALTTVLDALSTSGGSSDLGLAPLGGLFDRTADDAPLAGLTLSDGTLWQALRELLAPPPQPITFQGGPATAPGAASAPPAPDSLTVRSRDRGAPPGSGVELPPGVVVQSDVLGDGYEALLGLVPRLDRVERTFTLVEAGGSSRKTSGTYYTPPHLIDYVLDTALEPVLDDAVARATTRPAPTDPGSSPAASATAVPSATESGTAVPNPPVPGAAVPRTAVPGTAMPGTAVPSPAESRGDGPVAAALLQVTVLDPSCGSGRFLVAAGERIAARVAAARVGAAEPSPGAVRRAFRDVVGRCLYGVDLDPLAVELTRLSLWLGSRTAGRPISGGRVRQGNALIGATAEVPRADTAGTWAAEDGSHAAADAWCTAVLTGRASTASPLPQSAPGTRPAPGARPGQSASPTRGGPDDRSATPPTESPTESPSESASESAEPAPVDSPDARPHPKPGVRFTADEQSDTTGQSDRIAVADDHVARFRTEHSYFHWHLEFPEVFTRPYVSGRPPGFDCVVGNPPWERIKLQEQEFFAVRSPSIATAARAADRKRLIAELLTAPDPAPLATEYTAARQRTEARSRFLRTSGRFPLAGRGDINTYAVFVEAARELTSVRGRVGLLVPTGIATDATTRHLFQDLVRTGELATLHDFENRRGLFPDVDSRFRFCVLALTGRAVRRAQGGAEFAFYLQDPSELAVGGRRFTLTANEIALLNPNTRTCPVFRTRRDADITLGIYREVPVLSRDAASDTGPPNNAGIAASTPAGTELDPAPDPAPGSVRESGHPVPRHRLGGAVPRHRLGGAGADTSRRTGTDPWGAELLRMFDMSHDSRLFHTGASLEALGWQRDGGTYRNGDSVALPLYEAKLAHHFDHRWATYTEQGALRALTSAEKTDPHTTTRPRYWVTEDEVRAALPQRLAESPPPWLMGFRNVCRSTDERSVIAAPLPLTAVGNSLPVLTFRASSRAQAALLAMVSSFVFDYVARQKAGGTNLNYFIIRQLPFLTPDHLSRHEDFVLPRVLELTYTSHDMAPFTRSIGADGAPFVWSDERRAVIRAELDALFLRLYQVGRDDARHLLDSFPLVHRRDQERHGHLRTRDLVLDAYDRQPHRPGFRTRLHPPPGDVARHPVP